MAPEDQEGGVVGFRLGLVESQLTEFRKEMLAKFESLQADVRSAAFVPMNLYVSERDTFREGLKAVNARIDSQRTLVFWAIGTMITMTGVVVALVRAFG